MKALLGITTALGLALLAACSDSSYAAPTPRSQVEIMVQGCKDQFDSVIDAIRADDRANVITGLSRGEASCHLAAAAVRRDPQWVPTHPKAADGLDHAADALGKLSRAMRDGSLRKQREAAAMFKAATAEMSAS